MINAACAEIEVKRHVWESGEKFFLLSNSRNESRSHCDSAHRDLTYRVLLYITYDCYFPISRCAKISRSLELCSYFSQNFSSDQLALRSFKLTI